MTKQKVSMSWSGGKDSAFALHKILSNAKYEVMNIHTAFNSETKRVGMHGIPEALIEAQANSMGLPLEKIFLPPDTGNKTYEEVMREFCLGQKKKGVEKIVYGDIFLEDLKQYREKQLSQVGLEAVFPLWGCKTEDLIDQFIDKGFKTMICCADNKYFDSFIAGKTVTKKFIAALPASVDPCGENGEFHTFTYAGPLFKKPIEFIIGKTVLKHYNINRSNEETKYYGFWFLDLQ